MPGQGDGRKINPSFLSRHGGKQVDTRSTFRAFGVAQPVYRHVILTQRNILVLILKGESTLLKAFPPLWHTKKKHPFFPVC